MFTYDYYVRFVFDYSNVGVNVVHDMSVSPDEATPEELSEAEESVTERALELLADDGIVLPEANEVDVELLGVFGGY
jgi:predicted transcriptional regulator